MKNKKILFDFAAAAALLVLAGCGDGKSVPTLVYNTGVSENPSRFVETHTIESVLFDAESLSLSVNGLPVSLPLSGGIDSAQFTVGIEQSADCVTVTIDYLGGDEGRIVFPCFAPDSFTLPWGEGKFFAADDFVWVDYFSGETWELIESFSMSFVAAGFGSKAAVYIFPDNFNNDIAFSGDESLGAKIIHTFTTLNKNKYYSVRIYITDNDPVAIAKAYKKFVEENNHIKTLREKEAENPNVAKLYGAPMIYLFDECAISEENINWELLQNYAETPQMKQLAELGGEDGAEFLANLQKVAIPQKRYNYYHYSIARFLSDIISRPGLALGKIGTTETEQIHFNKEALVVIFPNLFDPVERWSDSRTVDLVADMKKSGIKNAWIGFNNWVQAYVKPELVPAIVKAGWLAGPYDNYNDVQQPGKEDWHTAVFPPEAWNDWGIQKKDGSYVGAYQNKGRALSPLSPISFPFDRIDAILANTVPFNSWFIDCDATGQVYDDYSPSHTAIKKDDYNARIARMKTIAEKYHLVMGSEGGNDYAVNAIAFAHGIELHSFSWSDPDMSDNKSEWYLGSYWALNGGVPEKFVKPIPVKKNLRAVYLDPAYNVPLYKLVYNNAVITAYHWDWPTLKIKDEVENRELYEMLYNVPPLYALDKFQWKENGKAIVDHIKEWAPWSREVIHEEMTDFQILSEGRLVQTAVYGDKRITVNFSDNNFSWNGKTIKARSYVFD